MKRSSQICLHKQQLNPVLSSIPEEVAAPANVLADTGYYSEDAVKGVPIPTMEDKGKQYSIYLKGIMRGRGIRPRLD